MGDNSSGTAQAGNTGRYTIVYRSRGSLGKAGCGQGKPDMERIRTRFTINYKISPDSPFLKSAAKNTSTAQEPAGQGQKLARQNLASIICGTESAPESELGTGFEIPELGSKVGTQKAGFGLWQNVAMMALACAQLFHGVGIFAKGYKQENASYEQCVAPATVNLMGLNFAPAPEQDETKKLVQQNLVAMGKGFEDLKAGLKANDTKKVQEALEQIKTSINFLDSRFSTLDYKDNIRVIARRVRECFIDETASTLQHALKFNADESHKKKIDLNDGYYNYVKFTIRGQDYTVENMLDAALEITRDSLAKLLKTEQKTPAKILQNHDKSEGKKGSSININDFRPMPVIELKIPGIVVPPLKTLDEMQGIKPNETSKGKVETPVKTTITAKTVAENKTDGQQAQETAQKLTNIGVSDTAETPFFHSQWLLYRRDFKVTEADRKATDKGVKEAIASLLGNYGYGQAEAMEIAKFTRENTSFTQKQFDAKFKGTCTYNELQAILNNAAQKINKDGMTIFGFASMEVLDGASNFDSQKRYNIGLGTSRAQLGKAAIVSLFEQFGVGISPDKIILNQRDGLKFIPTDVDKMCKYLEGGAYIHPVTGEQLQLLDDASKTVAQEHLQYMLSNGIVKKDSDGNYSATNRKTFSDYVTSAARGGVLKGADNPFMVVNRGVSLRFGTNVLLQIETIKETTSQPNMPIQIPGAVEMLIPGIKEGFDRTGEQWKEKVPVMAQIFKKGTDEKVADAVFNRKTGMFNVQGLAAGDYELRALATMGNLKASVTVPIKIKGEIVPSNNVSINTQNQQIIFSTKAATDGKAGVNVNATVYYTIMSFGSENGNSVVKFSAVDGGVLGRAEVRDPQGKAAIKPDQLATGDLIFLNGTEIGIVVKLGMFKPILYLTDAFAYQGRVLFQGKDPIKTAKDLTNNNLLLSEEVNGTKTVDAKVSGKTVNSIYLTSKLDQY